MITSRYPARQHLYGTFARLIEDKLNPNDIIPFFPPPPGFTFAYVGSASTPDELFINLHFGPENYLVQVRVVPTLARGAVFKIEVPEGCYADTRDIEEWLHTRYEQSDRGGDYDARVARLQHMAKLNNTLQLVTGIYRAIGFPDQPHAWLFDAVNGRIIDPHYKLVAPRKAFGYYIPEDQ